MTTVVVVHVSNAPNRPLLAAWCDEHTALLHRAARIDELVGFSAIADCDARALTSSAGQPSNEITEMTPAPHLHAVPRPARDTQRYLQTDPDRMTTPQTPQMPTRPIAELRPNPLNPRGDVNASGLDELAESIRAQGVLQPLLITPTGVLVAGHRRLAAARIAGLQEVPVVIRDLDAVEQQEIMLVENLQRQDLSPVEEARAYRRLLDAGHTTAQLARRLGAPAARINARLGLLKLDEQVQWMFHRGDLPLTLATVLCKVSDPLRQRQVATMAARRQLTVPEIERIVDRGIGALHAGAPKSTLPPDEPQKQRLSPSRVNALDTLAEYASASVSLGDLAELFRDTCCACGAEDLPTYCSACPMLDLVNRVVARVARGGRRP